jgi:hypothetical protein
MICLHAYYYTEVLVNVLQKETEALTYDGTHQDVEELSVRNQII